MMFSFNCNWGRSLICIIVILMCVASNLFSYTLLGTVPPGDPYRGYSARTTAMGNITAACIKDEPNLYFNPASIMYSTNRQLALSLNYIPAEEKFVIEDQAPLLNFNSYTLGSCVISLPLKDWAVGFGVFPLNDMQYRSEQETWTSAVLTEYKRIENSGTLYSYTISGAHKIGKFSFGFGVNFLKSDYEILIDTYDFNIREHTHNRSQNKLDGSNLTVSSVIDLSGNVLLGLSYIGETELQQEDNKKLKIPTQYTLSTTINVEEVLRTTLAFELILTDNKKTEFHLGLEHLSDFTGVPIRYGVGLVPHPADNKSYALSLTFGSGVELTDRAFLDFALSYENINTKLSDSFYVLQNSYKLICTTKFLF